MSFAIKCESVLYELIMLWGSVRSTATLMALGFIAVHTITVVFSGIAAGAIRRKLLYDISTMMK